MSIFALCKGIQDSLRFWIPRRGFRISGTEFQSFSVEIGFRNPIVSGIPNSLSFFPDSTSKIFLDSGFCKQKFLRFSNPDSVTKGHYFYNLLGT